MKNKREVKSNFLHIIPLHYSKVYNCFFLCYAQVVTFVVIPSAHQSNRKTILSGGAKFKKRHLFSKKGFTKLF